MTKKNSPIRWYVHDGKNERGEDIFKVVREKDNGHSEYIAVCNDEERATAIATMPAMLEVLRFTMNALEAMTTKQFELGGDAEIRNKIAYAIENAKGIERT